MISAATNWRIFPAQVIYQLIISLCVGSLFLLIGPLLMFYTDGMRPSSRWAIRIAGAAVLLNVGVCIGLGRSRRFVCLPVDALLGMVRDSVVPTTVFGVLCFVGFTMYESLKYRAQYEAAQARTVFTGIASPTALPLQHAEFHHGADTGGSGGGGASHGKTLTSPAIFLDATDRSTVRLEQELKVATDYLEIEKTRFGERLQYTIDVPQTLMQVEVPPFSRRHWLKTA